MARPLRIEYEGAIYHIVNRGSGRGAIFRDEVDRQRFLQGLGDACQKTGWQVHAWVLLRNHFHLVLETPEPNLGQGLKWLLGTYTQRFNLRHRRPGPLFQGRYKAQLIDERSPSYLRTACDYVHLNPVRARLLGPEEPLENYVWSSYGEYLRPASQRAAWLRVDRLLGEHGVARNDSRGRRHFAAAMARRCLEEREGSLAGTNKAIRRGWRLGGEDFLARLGEKLKGKGRRAQAHAGARAELEAERARRLVQEHLRNRKISWANLEALPKGAPVKVRLAAALRRDTTLSFRQIAQMLSMGSPGYVANLLCGHARPKGV